jgi:hypothetical protein
MRRQPDAASIVRDASVDRELLKRSARFLRGDEIDHGQIACPDIEREPMADRHALQLWSNISTDLTGDWPAQPAKSQTISAN